MESVKSFITLGWGNVAAAGCEVSNRALNPGDKCYSPPFRVVYRPPEHSWIDVLIVKYCEAQTAQ